MPKPKPKAKDGYNRNPDGRGGFKKGHHRGGRPPGSPNKIGALLKDQLIGGMPIAIEILSEKIDPKTKKKIYPYLKPYLEKCNGDYGQAYVAWFAAEYPQDFMQHAAKLIPFQFQHMGQQIIEHRHANEHAYIVKLLDGKDLSQLSMAELSSLYAEAIKPPPANQLKLSWSRSDD